MVKYIIVALNYECIKLLWKVVVNSDHYVINVRRIRDLSEISRGERGGWEF